MARDQRPSEFGGVPGLVQPYPHEKDDAEILRDVYATEPDPPLIAEHTVDDVVPLTQRKRR